ncbi:DNA polymerase III subunit delta' [Jiella sp. MQZ9-1]|uniref:DNA polymerase III subunit delta n=1 Tax=Jiella flava TaxID=2816857 RepID=A0A939JVU2_9HYPH|nr:DNA polymerase III subunit delta' [Jiella flava]MBO0662824.1 DNA polymerase III subunit delta' [Jiella flava]MCD2471415.1 DNA polymerase III subunit delta' [Jiella flava]
MSLQALDGYATHDQLDGVPQPFVTSRLIGHGEAFGAMREARASGRLHHAWLLQGPVGIGKATTAFAFARLLAGAAEHEDNAATIAFSADDPVFRQIAIGSLPGLIHITRPVVERGSGFRTQITVEEVRRLGRFFHATASSGNWRIAIVDPADDLNRSAANALLKLLEEPPARSLFLLVNHTPGRLLPTIRSRCRVARFEPLRDDEVVAALRGTGQALDDGEAASLVKAAEGSVRQALMLATHGGVEIEQALATMLGAAQIDLNGFHSLVDSLTLKGREASFELFLSALLGAIARLSEHHVAAGALGPGAAFAELWQAESRRIGEAAAFNLDRKQMALTTVSRLFALKVSIERRQARNEAVDFED